MGTKPVTSDPIKHQRDVGEREREPRESQATRGSGQVREAVEHNREKANRNNTHRNEQTGHAAAEAARVRKRAERAA
jgi:hypothetical protein